ncbi:MAG: ISKra4 family transposase [Acidobacteriia bacterium]|nr:ISKra4 family transposase [Terriglobia bacterium]
MRPPTTSAATSKKTALAEALQISLVGEIQNLLGAEAIEDLDFEALETALRTRSLQIAARALEQRFNRDTSDAASGALHPCSCGQMARYVDRRSKCFQTVLGDLTLERAYYHCPECQSGFCPRDRALGLDGALSPGVVRMIGVVGAAVSFEEGSGLLKELAGLHVGAKQVERTAESLGAEVAEDERSHVDPVPASEIAPTLYLGLDGTGIPVRPKELEGRAGKQEDGSAKTREVKLCTIWSAESRDEEGVPIRDPGSVTYSAAIESAAAPDSGAERSEFAERVLREATRRGFDRAQRRAILGDCAIWIWNTAGELFPSATQIADRYHVKGRLCVIAKAIYGPADPQAIQWGKLRRDELDVENIDAIIQALTEHSQSCEEARKGIDYFQNNRHRMRYVEFHAQGLCTSTGVVEAGCKVAIGERLKQSGMHWTVRGADAIIALRCARLSGRFEDFWERRSARRKVA